ncbi:MAG TPA: NapC/NirT family cytochrome c [bacterium]|nr:NapC/NirT family cytochrome c [bacterium]
MTEQSTSPLHKPLTHNWVSVFGFMLAMAFLVGEALIITLDFVYGQNNPYVGILIYVVGPAILILGLLMVPLGMWLQFRRRQKGMVEKEFPVFDLNTPRHRLYLTTFVIISTVFICLSMIGSYQAYHVTESTEFCGLMCHQVMKPEYTAYQYSPHARVDCVQCHIGPGASWYVKSKLSGLRQVWAVATNSYELPIQTPIENLRPARDTCEQCHWPEKFYEAVEKSLTYYANDDENTPYHVKLLLHVGGSSTILGHYTGIHWHIARDHKLEYYPADYARQIIPWVRVTHEDGRVEEFISTEATDFDKSQIDPAAIRELDCIDCHNRPSHRYESPFASVNQAMELGLIDPKLPGIKGVAVEALQGEYQTTPEALQAIEDKIRGQFEETAANDPEIKAKVDQAVKQTQAIFERSIFPEMKVDWTKYPSNIGHFDFPGCYRCHDGKHATPEGKVIRDDCNLCHSIIQQGEGWEEINQLEYKLQDFVHPRGLGDAWEGQNCHECHGPGMM